MPSNLPPGVTMSDIEGDECIACQGSGLVENPAFSFNECEPEYMTCGRCSGLGTKSTRPKERQDFEK